MGYNPDVPVTAYWNEEGADLYTMDGKYILSCPAASLASKSMSEADGKRFPHCVITVIKANRSKRWRTISFPM